MIRDILKKELLENIFGFRFVFSFLIFTSIIFLVVFLRLEQYQKDLDDWKTRVNSQEEFLKKYAHYRRISAVAMPHLPPSKMEPIVSEIPVDLTKFRPVETLFDNPIKIMGKEADLIFVFFVIGSLVVIVLSYDSFSREKEMGTISLLFSNSIRRSTFTIGKIFGTFVTSSLPLLNSILIISILIAVRKDIGWRFLEWTSFFSIIVITFFYLLVFSVLSNAISILTKNSITSILTLLFIWIFFNLIIPNFSPFISEILFKTPTSSQINKLIEKIDEERDKELKKEFKKYVSEGYTDAQAWKMGDLEKINQKYLEKIYKIQRDFEIKVKVQLFLSKNLSCISPTASFIYATKELSGAGFSRINWVQNQFQSWKETALDYLEKKKEEMMRNNPNYTFDDFIDVSDGPRFFYKEQIFSDRIKNALPYILLILFYAVVFFYLSLILINRADVR